MRRYAGAHDIMWGLAPCQCCGQQQQHRGRSTSIATTRMKYRLASARAVGLRQAWGDGCAQLDRTGRQITGRLPAMRLSRRAHDPATQPPVRSAVRVDGPQAA
jgi:hypothetical protein